MRFAPIKWDRSQKKQPLWASIKSSRRHGAATRNRRRFASTCDSIHRCNEIRQRLAVADDCNAATAGSALKLSNELQNVHRLSPGWSEAFRRFQASFCAPKRTPCAIFCTSASSTLICLSSQCLGVMSSAEDALVAIDGSSALFLSTKGTELSEVRLESLQPRRRNLSRHRIQISARITPGIVRLSLDLMNQQPVAGRQKRLARVSVPLEFGDISGLHQTPMLPGPDSDWPRSIATARWRCAISTDGASMRRTAKSLKE